MTILTHAVRQAWIALLVLAPAWFLVAQAGRVIQRAPLPEFLAGLPAFQRGAEPLLANAMLLLTAFVLAMTLPALVRVPRRLAAVALAILGIVLLGLAVLRVLRPDAALIAATSSVLVAALGAAALTTLRSAAPLRPRVVAGIVLAALVLPHVHRLALEFGGDPHSRAVAVVRDLAAVVVAASFALTVLAAPLHRRDVVVALPAFGAAIIMLIWYDASRDVLADTTGLWLTTLPRPAMIAAVTLAVFGVLRLVVHAMSERRAQGLAFGIMFLALAGFLPTRPEEALLAMLGCCMVVSWSAGRGETIGDLSDDRP